MNTSLSLLARLTLSLSLFGSLAATPLARADWEADLKISTGSGDGARHGATGKMYMKGSRLRMDSEAEDTGKLSMIFDHEKKKMTTLQHAGKAAIEMDLGQLGALGGQKEKDLIANCNPKLGATVCLKQLDFKRAGSEKVNGFDCEIYEKKEEGDGGAQLTRLWHPKGMEEVPSVRVIRKDSAGKLVQQIDLLNLKAKAIPETVFAIPSDYQKRNMSAMMQGLGDMMNKMGAEGGAARRQRRGGRNESPAGFAAPSKEGMPAQFPKLDPEQMKKMKEAMQQFQKAMEAQQKEAAEE
jgi:hypothetical protein